MENMGDRRSSMRTVRSLDEIRERLIRRRDDIYETHARAQAARQTLVEPEIEPEEMAQKGSIVVTLDEVDERERREIDAIDQALEKMKSGKFGHCEVCGRPIARKRLEAIPWATFCTRHAGENVEPTATLTQAGLPLEAEGSEENDLAETILEELSQDGDVELEELNISFRGDVLHLQGFLPTEVQHRQVLDIVLEHVELEHVVDEIVVSQTPWTKDDLTHGGKAPEDMANELESVDTGEEEDE
jgi:DnaK suppressor protein